MQLYDVYGDWLMVEGAGTAHDTLTPTERVELADFMIARWQAFRERAAQASGWTGGPPGLLQDDSAGLSKALSNKPGAWSHARDAAALAADAARYRRLAAVLLGAKAGGGIEVNCQRQVYEQPQPGEEVRIYWYEHTPVGFEEVTAATLDEAVDGLPQQAPVRG